MSTSDVSDSKPPILAIAAPVRGEAPYLLEWIAYHRALGIKAFLLADNAGDDEETSKLLQTLHERRIIFRFDWRDQTRFQLKFYRQALGAARLFADGLFLIDVDEFLRPEAGRSVSQIAQKWLSDPSLGAVGLNWAIYGSSDRVQAGEGLVIERFTRRALQDFVVNRHTKTFVRVASCAGPSGNPHAMSLLSGRYTDPRGDDIVWDTTRRDPVGISTKVIWDVLRVDHFAVKSHEEFLAKQARGNLIQPERNWGTYFAVHDRNDVEDPIPSELVHRTKGEIGLLKSLTQSCATEWSPASPKQKARVMLRRPVVSDLIIDVGMSEGNDSEFYLQKGFRVVGIEADPIVFAQLCKRFDKQISDQRIIILNRAAAQDDDRKIEFWRNEAAQGLSSIIKNKQALYENTQTKYEVQTISWGSIVEVAGTPYYCKIDIEGGEAAFLTTMVGTDAIPTYISAEVHTFAPIEILYAIGYRRFKIVDQKILNTFEMPNPSLEGTYVPRPNWAHASGPFGRELMGPHWLDFREVAVAFDSLMKLRSYRTMAWTWYDCHAWMPPKDA